MSHEFSIIIPTLNEEKYLPNLLADLDSQTYSDFDLIIVDAQSQDNTRQVADEFSQKLNLTFLDAKTKGISAQRNFGASHSSSRYLFFIDADARLDTNALKEAAQAVTNYKHLVYLPVHIPQDSKFDDAAMQTTINFLTEISQITYKPFSYGPSMIFERHFFSFLGGFNQEVTFFEDHEIVQRARRCGVIAKLLRDVQVQFSMRRFREEGRFTVLQKYLTATAHMYLKGEITDDLFEYEWGGKRYMSEEKRNTLEERIDTYLKKMKNYINTLADKGKLI